MKKETALLPAAWDRRKVIGNWLLFALIVLLSLSFTAIVGISSSTVVGTAAMYLLA